jgi:hypothetical protein
MRAKQNGKSFTVVTRVLGAGLVLGAVVGCTSTTPVLDSKFREATESSKSAQRIAKQYPAKAPLPQAAEVQPAFAAYLQGDGASTKQGGSSSSSPATPSQSKGSQTGAQ